MRKCGLGPVISGAMCWADLGASPLLRSWNHLGAPGQELVLCFKSERASVHSLRPSELTTLQICSQWVQGLYSHCENAFSWLFSIPVLLSESPPFLAGTLTPTFSTPHSTDILAKPRAFLGWIWDSWGDCQEIEIPIYDMLPLTQDHQSTSMSPNLFLSC